MRGRIFGIVLTTRYVLLSIFFMLTGVGCASDQNQDDSHINYLKDVFEHKNNGQIMIAAHRGCWSVTPENTVAALNHCVDIGVDIMEIDVQLTSDRKLVVFHDRTLDRMTNGTGYLALQTLDELKKLNLYERDGSVSYLLEKKIITNHKVATLKDILVAAKGKIFINLEIKANKYFSFEQVFNASTKLAKDMGLEDHVLWKIPSPSRVYDVDIVGDFRGDDSVSSKSTAFVSELDLEGLSYVIPIINNTARSFTQKLNDYKQQHNINSYELITTDLNYWQLKNGKIIDTDKNRYMAIALKQSWCGGLSDDIALHSPDKAWGRLIDLGFGIIMTDRAEQLVDYLRIRGLNTEQ